MNFPAGTDKSRIWIIGAALLSLFLGALDALVMSAAMPTIISELGGLHLYAWTYTAYFLSRAVSLPVFGKLSDLYSTKGLFLFSIGLFLISSIAAGASPSMGFLVAARVFQGIGGRWHLCTGLCGFVRYFHTCRSCENSLSCQFNLGCCKPGWSNTGRIYCYLVFLAMGFFYKHTPWDSIHYRRYPVFQRTP